MVIKFSDRLKKLRKYKEMNQAELAEKIGVARTTIANYEQGIRFPKQETLVKIAKYFSVSIDYLLGYSTKNIKESTKVNSKLIKNQNFAALEKTFRNYLMNGQLNKGYNLVAGMAENGMNLITILEEIFKTSFVKLDILWEKNEVSNSQMLNCAKIAEKIITQLIPLYSNCEKKDFSVVSACVNGEKHSLGLQMFNAYLRVNCGKVYYLGENVDTLIIVQALKDFKPNLVALSATLEYNNETMSNVIEGIRTEFKDIPIIVGGNAVNYNHDKYQNFNLVNTLQNFEEIFSILDF